MSTTHRIEGWTDPAFQMNPGNMSASVTIRANALPGDAPIVAIIGGQTPSSELISAGNAMRHLMEECLMIVGAYSRSVAGRMPDAHKRSLSMIDKVVERTKAWDAALAAHPKDPAPTSQAIGEQTPVDEAELIRQMKNAPVVLVPAMSSEARDRAIVALKAAHREAQESRKHFSSDLDRIHIASLVVQLSQALSALHGE